MYSFSTGLNAYNIWRFLLYDFIQCLLMLCWYRQVTLFSKGRVYFHKKNSSNIYINFYIVFIQIQTIPETDHIFVDCADVV